MISYGDKMACHITDGPQTPDDDPTDGYNAVDEEDRAYEEARQEAIDDAIEAGDHMLDQWKEDSLVNALEDIARSKA